MDCRVFNNKLEDFQNGCLPEDIENAMKKHMGKCRDCGNLYTLEQDMNTSFAAYFDIDSLEHESKRNEIMKKIDKGRYGRSTVKKAKYNFLTNKRKYFTTAAALITIILLLPFMKNLKNLSMGNAKTSTSSQSQAYNSAVEKNESFNTVKSDGGGIQVNYYKISKDEALKMINESYNVTKAVSSPDNKRRAMIYGKGQEMIEEGFSKVILQDINKNEYYIIELNDKNTQLTVKGLTWKDNDNILAIIGHAYGTVTRGGNVYSLNLDTGELTLVYKTKNDKTEVTSIKRGDEFHYILNINEYTDDDLLNSKQYQENLIMK